MDTPRRDDGQNHWKHLILSFYSYISIKLLSIQVDTLHVRYSNVVKCIIDTTSTKEIQLESVRGRVNLEWFKTGVRSESTDITVSSSPVVLMSKSPSVSECPSVKELTLTRVNVTFKLSCLKADMITINESMVTQDEFSIQLNANSFINVSNSIVCIEKGLTIVAINATIIHLQNTTFKTAGGANVAFFATKMFVSDTSFHNAKDTLNMIASSINKEGAGKVVFVRNNFTNSSVDILKLYSQPWTYVHNRFSCTCYLGKILNESLLDEEFFELNYCHLSKCELTLRSFVNTLNYDEQLCNTTDDAIDSCSNIENRQLAYLKQSNLYIIVSFALVPLLIFSAFLVYIRTYTKSSHGESLLQQKKQAKIKIKKESPQLLEASKLKEDICNSGLPDIFCDIYYSPVAEDGSCHHFNSSKCGIADIYSNTLDSVDSGKVKIEEENAQIYADVCDALYSVVDYSKKKKHRQEKRTCVSDESVMISPANNNEMLTPPTNVVNYKEVYNNCKCLNDNDSIYSEVNESDKATGIYYNPYSNVEENIVPMDSKFLTKDHDRFYSVNDYPIQKVKNDFSTDGFLDSVYSVVKKK